MVDPCGIPSGLVLWVFLESGLLCILPTVFGTIPCSRLFPGVVVEEESRELLSRICFCILWLSSFVLYPFVLGFLGVSSGFFHFILIFLDLVYFINLL